MNNFNYHIFISKRKEKNLDDYIVNKKFKKMSKNQQHPS
jgi:hypothetical protein